MKLMIVRHGDPDYSIDSLTETGWQEAELLSLRLAALDVKAFCCSPLGRARDTAKGNEIAATALTQFGADIDVIFCNNDGMALGAAQAISAADRTVGKDIYLVGVDALDECQTMVKEGTMTGTVLNDHIGQSHKAVDVAIELLNGKEIQNYYWVDYLKVDKAYMDAKG